MTDPKLIQEFEDFMSRTEWEAEQHLELQLITEEEALEAIKEGL
jgi:hypothetical protein